MCPTDALEERRKPTTLRKVPREHAGKITQPYKIMERLIDEVEDFAPLKNAKIVILWKSGWKPTKDDILCHAKIRKVTELERETWGDECDLCLLLHRELWQSSRFTEDEREMDVFHELCHPVPEIDDKTSDQKKDDRGRLCWRLRKHPIQRFPEEIDRYGIADVLQLDESAIDAVDDEASKADAIADENDAERPLLKQAEKNGNWRQTPINKIGLRVTDAAKLSEGGIETAGELQERMTQNGTWWARGVKGIGDAAKERVEDVFNRFIMTAESEPATEAE